MDPDEREIYLFLKAQPEAFVNVREICRRAGGKKRFHQDPEWAKPVLAAMLERGILERDILGRFRIKPRSQKGKAKRWISPDIAQILKESGVEVESTGDLESDDYYEQL
jgi:hypothetical protein